ncbi:unnamed protein product, partial [Heterosigma akashiwo]
LKWEFATKDCTAVQAALCRRRLQWRRPRAAKREAKSVGTQLRRSLHLTMTPISNCCMKHPQNTIKTPSCWSFRLAMASCAKLRGTPPLTPGMLCWTMVLTTATCTTWWRLQSSSSRSGPLIACAPSTARPTASYIEEEIYLTVSY